MFNRSNVQRRTGSFQTFSTIALRSLRPAPVFALGFRSKTAARFSVPIEADEHLHRRLVYIDLNMVRAGVVNHFSRHTGLL